MSILSAVPNSLKVLVTGASGFVGSALCPELIQRKFVVHRQNRDLNGVEEKSELVNFSQEIQSDTNWSLPLTGVDVVIHLAARVHVMQDKATDPLSEFRKVNVDGTLNLARQAAAMGVKRFVFVSSVKVNGESTPPGMAFAETDTPNPQDSYGQSKHEAEQGLREVALQTGMAVVIIRPPLVYGQGVKANFAALARAVQCGWPLPLGAVHNKRSVVALDNLVDFIVTCVTHPAAANQTFLVSDGQDVSTTELARGLANALGVTSRLIPVPVWLLQAGAWLLGKRDAARRLCGNLQVDISKARTVLGWVPPITLKQGLQRIAKSDTKS